MNTVFNNPVYILQLRQNIISQAVSLFLATETGFFHASNKINSNNTVEYNGLKIQNWAKKLLQQEKFLCQFLTRQETPRILFHGMKTCRNPLKKLSTGLQNTSPAHALQKEAENPTLMPK
ncbi:MAG: hypothetical protein IPK95_08165 [Cellvibrionales bacterium]|nr:hypothetical protein [Cellvibrionales bacterium]